MKKNWVLLQSFAIQLSRSLKLFYHRQDLILAEQDEFTRLLNEYASRFLNDGEKFSCEICNETVDINQISAFRYLGEGMLEIFCDRPSCISRSSGENNQ